MGCFPLCGPPVWREGFERFGGLGRVRQAGEQIGQAGLCIDASPVAVADQGATMGVSVKPSPVEISATCGAVAINYGYHE